MDDKDHRMQELVNAIQAKNKDMAQKEESHHAATQQLQSQVQIM
jgi:hypothetical protein